MSHRSALIPLLANMTINRFADERTLNAAAHFGLQHNSSEELANQVEELLGPAKDEEDKRRRFTTIVDALVACDLEHKYGEVEARISGKTEEDEKDSKSAKKE